jgi:hypothetical protein
MADNLYMVRVYVDVCLFPRGMAGAYISQNNSNIGGYGSTQGPGPAPMGQTMRFQQDETVPNAIATPPTAANIGTAIASAATDIQGQITTTILGTIQGWATGGQ